MLLTGCSSSFSDKGSFSVERMNEKLLESAKTLPKSQNLFFENGLEITGLGVTFDGRPKSFDGCYYFPAIESLTGAHVAVDWHEADGYSSTVAAVGEERMDAWKSSDGHIYTIPSVSMIRGSFSTQIRKDWLAKLGMTEPKTWEDWLKYWRGVRDNDLNGNGDKTDEIPLALAGGEWAASEADFPVGAARDTHEELPRTRASHRNCRGKARFLGEEDFAC